MSTWVYHESLLLEILKDAFFHKELAPYVGCKGGTARARVKNNLLKDLLSYLRLKRKQLAEGSQG